MVKVTYYITGCAATLKLKTDITKLKHILDSKIRRQIISEYEEVDLSMDPHRRAEMLVDSGGVIKLPQLHVDGKLIGDADYCQELEDWGELDYVLRGEPIPVPEGLTAAEPSAPNLEEEEEASEEEASEDEEEAAGNQPEAEEGAEAAADEQGQGATSETQQAEQQEQEQRPIAAAGAAVAAPIANGRPRPEEEEQGKGPDALELGEEAQEQFAVQEQAEPEQLPTEPQQPHVPAQQPAEPEELPTVLEQQQPAEPEQLPAVPEQQQPTAQEQLQEQQPVLERPYASPEAATEKTASQQEPEVPEAEPTVATATAVATAAAAAAGEGEEHAEELQALAARIAALAMQSSQALARH